MKNQFTSRIVKLTFAFMFILIASSCSEDNDAMDAAVLAKEINNEIAAKGAKVSASVVLGTFTVPSEVCAGVATSLCLNFPQATKGNGDPKETNVQIQLLVDGDNPETLEVIETEYYMQIGAGNFNVEYCLSYTFTTAGEYQLRYKIGSETTGFVDTTVTVTNCGCPYDGNGFTGTAVSCGTSRVAEYTFTSEDGVGNFKMQGGLNNFTGTNATVYVNDELVIFSGTSSDDWTQGITLNGYTVGQRTPGQSSNRNIRIEGGLDDCSAVVVRIEWTTSNTGATMTGEWTVKDAGLELALPVADLVCPN
ncbi:MAG: hypothetical protein CVU01_00745 [Bacteroidetes bacterium HGW-Bacteroidetes-18]|nr:MAG: hypothetical protein CVU01_00745 [Bacteroidetes bacterium HGW-Bacteroidetes-18]